MSNHASMRPATQGRYRRLLLQRTEALGAGLTAVALRPPAAAATTRPQSLPRRAAQRRRRLTAGSAGATAARLPARQPRPSRRHTGAAGGDLAWQGQRRPALVRSAPGTATDRSRRTRATTSSSSWRRPISSKLVPDLTLPGRRRLRPSCCSSSSRASSGTTAALRAADDAAFSLQRMAYPPQERRQRLEAVSLCAGQGRASDPTTLRVTLKQPSAAMPCLAMGWMVMLRRRSSAARARQSEGDRHRDAAVAGLGDGAILAFGCCVDD